MINFLTCVGTKRMSQKKIVSNFTQGLQLNRDMENTQVNDVPTEFSNISTMWFWVTKLKSTNSIYIYNYIVI